MNEPSNTARRGHPWALASSAGEESNGKFPSGFFCRQPKTAAPVVALSDTAGAHAAAKGLGERFAYSREIVVHDVDSPAAVDHALWLFQINYDYLRGTKIEELLARVEAKATNTKR